MNRMVNRGRLIACIIIANFLPYTAPAVARADTVVLENKKVEIAIMPELGGRVVGFSVPNKPNVLMVNKEKLNQPVTNISPSTAFIEYFGHINWVSPQSQWWIRQNLDPEKKARGDFWPPDPFLVYGKNTVIERNKNLLRLAGIGSPVSGVQFLKQFKLVEKRPGTVDLHVSAVNVRDTDISWGIWFNTRVQPAAQVYVPIFTGRDVRIDNYNPKINIPADFKIADGFFSYTHGVVPTADKNVRSKAFIQPAQGWMAAFLEGQVFIIQFPLWAREKIHPEQGQVEIYHSYNRDHKNGGMLEMELHAPYTALKPGEKIYALERWTVLPYGGRNMRADHIAFLTKLADRNIISKIEP